MGADAVTAHKADNAKKLEKVASWVKSGLASAFFASLEKCSCIHLATTDEDHDERTDADGSGETDRVHLMPSRKAEEGIPWGAPDEEAPVQNWADQTLPFMSSPYGIGKPKGWIGEVDEMKHPVEYDKTAHDAPCFCNL